MSTAFKLDKYSSAYASGSTSRIMFEVVNTFKFEILESSLAELGIYVPLSEIRLAYNTLPQDTKAAIKSTTIHLFKLAFKLGIECCFNRLANYHSKYPCT
eukprot:346263_1